MVHLRALLMAAAWTPALLVANVGLMPPGFTGAPVDGGRQCAACHTGSPPVNQGPGRLLIRANAYTPGVLQTISVEVTDTTALRWGFQLTARMARNPANKAGSFAPSDSLHVVCADGSLAPCGGETTEFVAHTVQSSTGGQGGSRTWAIQWTPPGRDAGAVVFYAAGIAGNNDGRESGDRTYTASVQVAAAECNLSETPQIRTLAPGIVNAGSFESGIAPNGMFTVFGNGFASTQTQYAAVPGDLVNGVLQPDLACVAVRVGTDLARPFYVQSGQINAQAPLLETLGNLAVQVVVNPGTPNERSSPPVGVNASPAKPGFFTFNGRSIAALNGSRNNAILAEPSVVRGGVTARPGDVVILYGTGFGLTDPVYQPGEFSSGLAPLREAPVITIGGITLSPAQILYAGLSPDAPGFYQFNVVVPPATPDGDIPVTIRMGSAITQGGATIPVRR